MEQVVIIPTVDPDERIVSLVGELQCAGFAHIIVVDDGSCQSCQAMFANLELCGCTVVHHTSNCGKGAAIKTGLDAMRRAYPRSRGAITVDDDGQHLAMDALRVACASTAHPEAIAIGVRDLHGSDVPLRSRFGNAFSALFFRLDTGVACADTQTGLRCIPAPLVGYARSVEGERYEYEMNELTQAAKDGIDLVQVPITAVYEKKERRSHFRPVADSVRIYRSLIRFTMASLSCAMVDLGLFTLLTSILGLDVVALVTLATVSSRMASGLLNFLLNRRWSFRSTDMTGRRALRYAALFAAQMFLSASLVSLFAFLPVPLVGVKVVVDSVLFVFSFFFQRNWVFRPVSSDSKEARKRAGGVRKHERALESRPDVGLCDERVDIRR